MQYEHTPRGPVFLDARILGEHARVERRGEILVPVLGLGKLHQKFADRSVAGPLGGAAVESRGLEFGVGRIFTHLVEAQWPHQPDRPMVDEAAHVLAPHQRQKLAEFGAVEIVEHAAVAGLLGRHFVDHLCGGRILRAQPFREVLIDAAVLLLVADRKGEDFLLGQIGEAFHHAAGPIQ